MASAKKKGGSSDWIIMHLLFQSSFWARQRHSRCVSYHQTTTNSVFKQFIYLGVAVFLTIIGLDGFDLSSSLIFGHLVKFLKFFGHFVFILYNY